MSDEQPSGARTELTPDAWHQNDQGNYYLDCPECGSAATLMNIVTHGRCNGYLDQVEDETELDEKAMDCTARLSLELVWDSDPGPDERDETTAEAEDEDVIGAEGEADADPDVETVTSSDSTQALDSDADADRPADSDG